MSNSSFETLGTASDIPEKVTPPTEPVLILPKSRVANLIIALVFFFLGALVTSLSIGGSARSTEQIIDQAVAAAMNELLTAREDQADAGLEAPGNRLEVSVDDDPSYGPVDAPVTIIEFSDFNCPYCARFVVETLPLLRDTYGDQIRFVYRDFAILGPSSIDAAIAGECAADQSAFWDYHDLLFANQRNFARHMLIGYAQELELDAEAFTACLDDISMRDEVVSDTSEAQRLGATGTPTFFINGRPLIGAQPFVAFSTIIDEELNAGNSDQ